MPTKKKIIYKKTNKKKLTNSANFTKILLKIEYLTGYIAGLKETTKCQDLFKLGAYIQGNIRLAEEQIKKYKDELNKGK